MILGLSCVQWRLHDAQPFHGHPTADKVTRITLLPGMPNQDRFASHQIAINLKRLIESHTTRENTFHVYDRIEKLETTHLYLRSITVALHANLIYKCLYDAAMPRHLAGYRATSRSGIASMSYEFLPRQSR